MTEKDIIRALFFWATSSGHKFCASNTQAIMGVGEADFVTINRAKYLCEFEIKVSRSDYRADFRNKPVKHQRMKDRKCEVNYFTFVCPEGLIDPEEVPEYAGLLYAKELGDDIMIYSAKKSKRLSENQDHDNTFKKMYVSLMHKYYRSL